MKARIKFPPKRAALFNIPAEKSEKICKIFSQYGIETLFPDIRDRGEKIGYLLGVPGYTKTGAAAENDTESDELILFADLDEKTLDNALAGLRENGVTVRFKAVLTKYNKDFTYSGLMRHMLSEEKKIAENTRK